VPPRIVVVGSIGGGIVIVMYLPMFMIFELVE
jgi:type II secretory pathway component PulF